MNLLSRVLISIMVGTTVAETRLLYSGIPPCDEFYGIIGFDCPILRQDLIASRNYVITEVFLSCRLHHHTSASSIRTLHPTQSGSRHEPQNRHPE